MKYYAMITSPKGKCIYIRHFKSKEDCDFFIHNLLQGTIMPGYNITISTQKELL